MARFPVKTPTRRDGVRYRVFRIKSESDLQGRPLRLHRHQSEAIRVARTGFPYVLTTGTGSGKSLSYIVPIVDHVLRAGNGKGIRAIVVYPMNALARHAGGAGPKRAANLGGGRGFEIEGIELRRSAQ
ncbi:MAG: DEAD/DEAH box helicase [Gemmataceae bacterium]|nr:DEAD/DEAH box helicase [Gemmataceae bacterium]